MLNCANRESRQRYISWIGSVFHVESCKVVKALKWFVDVKSIEISDIKNLEQFEIEISVVEIRYDLTRSESHRLVDDKLILNYPA